MLLLSKSLILFEAILEIPDAVICIYPVFFRNLHEINIKSPDSSARFEDLEKLRTRVRSFEGSLV